MSAEQEFAFRPDPLVALMEMMILAARMRDYFGAPTSDELVGPPIPWPWMGQLSRDQLRCPVTSCILAVSTYCWNFVTLPSAIVQTWQTWASRGLPVAL